MLPVKLSGYSPPSVRRVDAYHPNTLGEDQTRANKKLDNIIKNFISPLCFALRVHQHDFIFMKLDGLHRRAKCK